MVLAAAAAKVTMSKFGQELKQRRLDARMSLAQLAEAADVSKTYIDNLERDKPHPVTGALPNPSPEKVTQIANALKWPVREALEMVYLSGVPETPKTFQPRITITNDTTGEIEAVGSSLDDLHPPTMEEMTAILRANQTKMQEMLEQQARTNALLEKILRERGEEPPSD